jgi:hypothetical protein
LRSISKQARLNQKIIQENCTSLGKEQCNTKAYNQYYEVIMFSNRNRLGLLKTELIIKETAFDYFHTKNTNLKVQTKLLKTNSELIELYLNLKMDGIAFSRKKAFYEINEIANNSRKQLDTIKLNIKKLTRELE